MNEETETQDYIYELEREISDLREAAKRDQLWTTHIIDESADTGGLPVPRLELVWEQLDKPGKHGYSWYCRYDLVKNHLLGEIHRIPLGGTSTTGYHDMKDGSVSTPFRDGAHILFDALDLGLPAYAIKGDLVTKLTPSEHTGVQSARDALLAKSE